MQCHTFDFFLGTKLFSNVLKQFQKQNDCYDIDLEACELDIKARATKLCNSAISIYMLILPGAGTS